MNNGISVSTLPWDSTFFGFPVGSLVVPCSEVRESEIRDAICASGCKLVYVFLPVADAEAHQMTGPRSALVLIGGRCLDLKLTYHKRISREKISTCRMPLAAESINPKLISLAYASGWCSRFAVDARLASFFKPMYLQWLKRDLVSGKVFVRPSVNSPEGMATASVRGNVGRVGLLAVDAKHCGRGIATELLKDLDTWFFTQGVEACEVITQGVNLAARHLYEKAGFRLKSQTEVWHVWNDKMCV